MQHEKYRSRVLLILVVLGIGLYGIFIGPGAISKAPLFDSSKPWSQRTALKPGIDIKGGISLLYEIKAPPGNQDTDLAAKVADSLKKRVDPEGVKNLVWRPQGATKLEIQMPLSGNAEETKAARDAYSKAQSEVEKTNLRLGEVRAALEITDHAARQKRLDELSQGFAVRKDLLHQLADAYDKLQAAKKTSTETTESVQARYKAQQAYDDLEARIDSTNVSLRNLLNTVLDPYQARVEKAQQDNNKQLVQQIIAERDKKLQELYANSKDFPARLAALKDYVAAHDKYYGAKGVVDDAEDLKRMLVGSGVLEFHILYEPQTATAEDRAIADAMIKRLPQDGPYPRGSENSPLRFFEVDRPDELHGRPTYTYGEGDAKKIYALCYVTPDRSMVHKQGQGKDWALVEAKREFDSRTNEAVVGFKLDALGASLFGDLSGSHLHQALAIVLDNKLISAPTLQSRIEGAGQISGSYTDEQLDYLIRTLNAGSLPARLTDKPIRERLISPSLGAENLERGLRSCIIGLVVVAIFLLGYYYLMGSIAMVAVIMNLLVILGVLSLFGATFTLPGIAALVLTLGSAVDANVLIFERLREEEIRGLSLKLAIRNAYDRAFSAILDSNMITIITSVVLYYFGSEEVKGFGLTLLIGIACSLFTALFVTRVVYDFMLERTNIKRFGSLPLTFPAWQRALHPNIDWVGKAWYFVALSVVILIAGVAAFFTEGSKMYDIEFAQGTSVQLELKEPMTQNHVYDLLTQRVPDHEKILPSLQVVAVGSGATEREFEVVTPNANSDQVKEAVMKALEHDLNVDVASTFKGVDLKPADAVGQRIAMPIDEDTLKQYPWARSSLESNKGGLAILLQDLSPRLTPAQVLARLETARLQPDRANMPYRKFDVESPNGADAPSDTILIITSDEDFTFQTNEARWREQLADPIWKLTVDAINKPPVFKNVSRFDPQVAASTRTDATWALIISVIGVLIYIWIRFGNFKYGSATVVAMLHDVIIVVGAIGLSHYVGKTSFGQHFLLVEPFRINLTMVAAVLTVMGYSMVDTMVVFDRIRENRGKFGYISRQVINDSINQTLSRTLLTVAITMAMVFIMYVFGGPGIHGFTFALLVGILVGSYSSIAIAAPILLLSGKDVQRDTMAVKAPVPQLQKAAHG